MRQRWQRGTAGLLVVAAVALVTTGLSGCSTRVERIGMDERRDLSGRWNDTDSRLVSEAMVEELLASRWLREYEANHDEPPTVVVGPVRNLSHEHINVDTFVRDIEAATIDSGRLSFVAGEAVREAIRAERKQQDLHASEATRKAMGQEIGADFMLTGTLDSIVDTEGDESVIYYQVNLALTNIANNRRVWVGQKSIRKFVDRASLRP